METNNMYLKDKTLISQNKRATYIYIYIYIYISAKRPQRWQQTFEAMTLGSSIESQGFWLG
jgi:hypothetical protein